MTSRLSDRLYVVDLFCGMGGFSWGARMAGAEVVLAIDSWSEALNVHHQNHPHCTHVKMMLGGSLNQVSKLIQKHIPKGARWHLHGSPPCQKFSSMNKRTLDKYKKRDEQAGMVLVQWYLDLVRLCKPTSWSMEQVRGALKFFNPKMFGFCHLVNAAHYGLAETRVRLFVGNGWTLPAPSTKELSVADVLPKLSLEGEYIRGYNSNRAVTKNGKYIGFEPLEEEKQMRSIYKPSFTMCTIPLRLCKKIKNKFIRVRALTPKESLTIQGFPQSYKLNHIKTQDTYKLIGNSVCPPIAFLIIKSALSF